MQNAKGSNPGAEETVRSFPRLPSPRGQAEVGLAALRAAFPRRDFLGCFIFRGLILWPFVIPRPRGELGKLEITGEKFPPLRLPPWTPPNRALRHQPGRETGSAFWAGASGG